MEGALDLFAMASALMDSDDEGADESKKLEPGTMEAWVEEAGPWKGLDGFKDGSEMSLATFKESYEKPGRPVLLQGLAQDWPAQLWTFDGLEERFGEVSFALHSGQTFPLQEYLRYCDGRGEIDPAPLYLFEDLSLLEDTDVKREILQEYEVPKYFAEDLFEMNGFEQHRRRPRFRWMLVGPARSGTKVHVDPICTSAWNTLLLGHKRWVLFPPDLNPELVRAIQVETSCVEEWFASVLPTIKSSGMIEFTQKPGETVFVPAGWWHIVINLDMTLAVTQNFASKFNLAKVAEEMRRQPVSEFKTAWFRHMGDKTHALWDNLLPSCFSEGFLHTQEIVQHNYWLKSDTTFLEQISLRYNNEFALKWRQKNRQEVGKAAIPRVIHLIWLGDKPLPFGAKCFKSWAKFHNDAWQVRLWRDKDIEKFGLKNAALYAAAPNFGAKSDIARLEILERFGGIYVDIDVEALGSLDQVVDMLFETGFTFAMGLSNSSVVEISNAVLMSTAHNPALLLFIESLSTLGSLDGVKALLGEATREERTAVTTGAWAPTWTVKHTGSGFLTRLVAENWDALEDVLIFPTNVCYPMANTDKTLPKNDDTRWPSCSLMVHYWSRSWEETNIKERLNSV